MQLVLIRAVQSGIVAAMMLCPIPGWTQSSTQAEFQPAPPLSHDSVQSKKLPPGVLKALYADEAQCCKEISGEFEHSCHHKFVAHLRWRELKLAHSGKAGILVENRNQGFCGSAGCALHLFIRQSSVSFDEVLDEVGALENIKTLKSVSKGYYDLRKISSNRKTETVYRWDGSIYSAE